MQGSDLFWTVLGGILLLALGIFMFFRPDLVWKLTERWKSYRANEPSDFYLLCTKIGGVIVMLIGIAIIFLSLTVL